jgi:hypothetical protein
MKVIVVKIEALRENGAKYEPTQVRFWNRENGY